MHAQDMASQTGFYHHICVCWRMFRFYVRVMIPQSRQILFSKNTSILSRHRYFSAPASLSYVFTSELMLSLWDWGAKAVIGHGSSILQSFPKAFHPKLWEDEWKWVASQLPVSRPRVERSSKPVVSEKPQCWVLLKSPSGLCHITRSLCQMYMRHFMSLWGCMAGRQTGRHIVCVKLGWTQTCRDHQKSFSLLILHKCF